MVPVQVKRIDSWYAGSFFALTPKETVHEIGRQDHAADCSILMELGEAHNEVRYGKKEIADEKVERLYAHIT